MNTPLTLRITQIELAMERLRWLPELSPGRSIIVNIPAFQLWAFNDRGETDTGIVNMKVVVGKALENQTPVLMAELSFIDFMPYWNIPYSITKGEILPKWLEDNNYLSKEDMELVYSFGNNVKPVTASDSSLSQVKQGLLKIRQRPGKKNPLGQVKFIFPNKDDVYLHGTPANALFSKSRRDFSHGCVRVENPELLAEFALKNQDEWTKEAIQLAMKSKKTERVVLKKSIPVLFFYMTSFIDQNDKLVFYPDIYGHDAALLGALQKTEDFADSLLFVSSQPTFRADALK
jgi:murein L,D-transpeptidase YcbB/YkuD